MCVSIYWPYHGTTMQSLYSNRVSYIDDAVPKTGTVSSTIKARSNRVSFIADAVPNIGTASSTTKAQILMLRKISCIDDAVPKVSSIADAVPNLIGTASSTTKTQILMLRKVSCIDDAVPKIGTASSTTKKKGPGTQISFLYN